ncbi:MAG: hypothetical protein HKN00_13760 [Flavobacteriaceae bacterium]|nr:hypothetical protein [Bacteroidia bacterium]NNF76246.1 hypothetical protein [Flavobacteriaceae bacterium]
MSKFFNELKRRNVIKATIAYLVVAWVLLQVATVLLDSFHSPDWIKQAFIIFLAIGLPIWIVISWIYDFTPEGIEVTSADSEDKRVTAITNKRLNAFIIVGLSIAVIVLAIKPSFLSSNAENEFTIAVLPFKNLNSDENNEWYNDAVTSDIHYYLSRIKNFHIISPQSVEKYKGTDKTTPEIAEELGASHIVGGNLRHQGNRISIAAHLNEASSDKQLWSEKYDEILDDADALRIQQDISKKIVQELELILSPADAMTLDVMPTQNPEAFEYFKKGKALSDKRNAKNSSIVLPQSIELLKKAIVLDSNYAEAYAEMALMKFISRRSSPDEINYLNEKALELNEQTARVYSTRGLIQTGNLNFKEAKLNFEKAIELNPNDATTYQHFAIMYGRLPETDNKNRLLQARKAHKINPYSSTINNVLLYSLLANDKVEEAEEQLNKINYVYPDIGFSDIAKLEFKGLINSHKENDYTAIIEMVNEQIKTDPDDPLYNWYLGKMYNNVFNDDANYLKYCRIAYESDSTGSRRFSTEYFRSLLDNKKIIEADIFSRNIPPLRAGYYVVTDSLNRALEYINKPGYNPPIDIKLTILAKMGERDSIYQLFKTTPVYSYQKAIVYAVLKEKDSMYHYLNRSTRYYALNDINGNNAFNPYRKEERFKAFLRKNYLPITHLNE